VTVDREALEHSLVRRLLDHVDQGTTDLAAPTSTTCTGTRGIVVARAATPGSVSQWWVVGRAVAELVRRRQKLHDLQNRSAAVGPVPP
jgi:hypothetical protein